MVLQTLTNHDQVDDFTFNHWWHVTCTIEGWNFKRMMYPPIICLVLVASILLKQMLRFYMDFTWILPLSSSSHLSYIVFLPWFLTMLPCFHHVLHLFEGWPPGPGGICSEPLFPRPEKSRYSADAAKGQERLERVVGWTRPGAWRGLSDVGVLETLGNWIDGPYMVMMCWSTKKMENLWKSYGKSIVS